MSARQPVLDFRPEAYFQVAAVGYRHGKTEPEFLLVRTGSGRWTFPKGQVEPALGPRHSALLEAREEAGAYGTISRFPFGAYRAFKASNRGDRPAEFPVYAYLLQVTHQAEPAEPGRQPVWVTSEKGKDMLRLERPEPYAGQIAGVLDLALVILEGPGTQEAATPWRSPKLPTGNLYDIS